LFAYGPADATVIPKPHHLLPHLNPDWFYVCGTGLPRLSWKEAVKRGVVVVVVVVFMISVCTAAPVTVAGSRLSLTLRQRESPHHMLVDRRWFRSCIYLLRPYGVVGSTCTAVGQIDSVAATFPPPASLRPFRLRLHDMLMTDNRPMSSRSAAEAGG